MKKFKLLFIALIVACCTNGYCQEILSDFKKLNAHYLNMTSYSMTFQIAYESAGQGNLMIQEGNVLHTPSIHYTELGGNISLINKDEFVALNMYSKLLIYNKNNQKQQPRSLTEMDVYSLLDSLWQNQKGMSYRYLEAPKGQRKVYVEDSQNPYYSAYALTVSTSDYSLLEFIYYLKPEVNQDVNKIIIRYLSETSKPKINKPQYRVEHYVAFSAGKSKPAELYQNFKFIDQSQLQYENN